ncbi:MAG: VOC family protein [Rhizobiales bacterium]|nr:VOC family protein [Hyphomicrobiales bacterium]
MAGSTVIPTFRYRDAPRMIDWLCETLGFHRQAVYEDGAGGVAHAQLTLGDGMIMLGSLRDDAFGVFDSSPYVVVPDADAVYARVKASGVEIIQTIKDEDYGGRGFGFRDPEGNHWFVGTYDPWRASGA